MSTRLPADLFSRRRLEGIYRLRVAAARDITRPLYNSNDIGTVQGSSARSMSIADDTDSDANSHKKRLLKVVLADEVERLLVAYEFEAWDQGVAAAATKVGEYIEVVGPINLAESGVAMLSAKNVRLFTANPCSSVTAVTSHVYRPHIEDEWIHELPSDLFAPSTDNEVIVIDE